MKFATLIALIGLSKQQCKYDDECPADQYGKGSCCNILTAVTVPADSGELLGKFNENIWGQKEGTELKDGSSTTICVPAAYIEAHKAAHEKSGKETMPTTQNLQIVLDTVPGFRKGVGLEDDADAETWITSWGSDLDFMNEMQEKAACAGPNPSKKSASMVSVGAAALALATLSLY